MKVSSYTVVSAWSEHGGWQYGCVHPGHAIPYGFKLERDGFADLTTAQDWLWDDLAFWESLG